jgi:hypothetical protein
MLTKIMESNKQKWQWAFICCFHAY